MAITRVTSTVIEANAISAAKLANGSITTSKIAAGAITGDKLADDAATTGPISSNLALIETRTNLVNANLTLEAANTAAIYDATTDINIGSGKYFFDKSLTSFSINNTTPIAGTISLGDPSNVILKYSTLGGNVIIGGVNDITPHRLDVRGTANTGTLTATSFAVPNDGDIGSTGATDAIQISSGGIVTFKDDIKIKDGGTIGTATDPDAVTIAAAGAVTFSQRDIHSSGITVADGGQIGSATTAAAITIAADGLVTVGDDLSVTGNLTVLGSTTTVNTENLIIQDNFIALANSQPHGSATSLDSGIFFNRGSAGNAALYYDQSSTGFRLSETRDRFSNTVIKPTHDANLTLSNVFAETIKLNGADLATMISDNRSGAVSTVFATNLTASRALASDGSGKISVSAVTATELGYLDGVSSAIQTQLDAKIATTSSASNDFVTFTRLNANVNTLQGNVNIVQDNVAALTGGGILVRPFTNSTTQSSTANTFFIGKAIPGDGLANILSVTLDGVYQRKDQPGTANNDFIVNAAAAHASIKFTAPSIPAGSIITTTILF